MNRTTTAYHQQPSLPHERFRASLYLALTAALLLLGALSFPVSVNAGIYKCVASDGSVTYSQRECAETEKTAKILSNKGRSNPKLDCSVAESFFQTTIHKMREGVSSGDLFTNYGGMDSLSNFSLGAINYIYTYEGNLTTTPAKLQELTRKKCSVGSFGTPSCYALPTTLINQEGGCNQEPATAYAKPQKASSQSRQTQRRPAKSSTQRNTQTTYGQNSNKTKAQLERDRRRAQRKAERERNNASRLP